MHRIKQRNPCRAGQTYRTANERLRRKVPEVTNFKCLDTLCNRSRALRESDLSQSQRKGRE